MDWVVVQSVVNVALKDWLPGRVKSKNLVVSENTNDPLMPPADGSS